MIPNTGVYGALGHGVNDIDTMKLIPLSNGAIMDSFVTSVTKGENGKPGELIGEFELSRDYGTITVNCETGIYGYITDNSAIASDNAVTVAASEEVKTGKSSIMSNINGDTVNKYEIEITAIDCSRE
jgi:stage IV sporulation protein B